MPLLLRITRIKDQAFVSLVGKGLSKDKEGFYGKTNLRNEDQAGGNANDEH